MITSLTIIPTDQNAYSYVFQTKTDITIEEGQFDAETLLNLAIKNLAIVTDRQPALNKASVLLAKVRWVVGRPGKGEYNCGQVLLYARRKYGRSSASFYVSIKRKPRLFVALFLF